MQIQKLSTQKYYQNFGMALDISKVKKSKDLAPYVLKRIEKLTPGIEKIATDVDVNIIPVRLGSKTPNLLEVNVKDKNASFWNKIMSELGLRHPYKNKVFYAIDEFIKDKRLVESIKDQKLLVKGYLEN